MGSCLAPAETFADSGFLAWDEDEVASDGGVLDLEGEPGLAMGCWVGAVPLVVVVVVVMGGAVDGEVAGLLFLLLPLPIITAQTNMQCTQATRALQTKHTMIQTHNDPHTMIQTHNDPHTQ